MKKEYDLKKMKKVKPKYLKNIKEAITIRLDTAVIEYFKELSDETSIPYQSLINYVLFEYVEKGLRPSANWGSKLGK